MDFTPFYIAAGREARTRGNAVDKATAALLRERLSITTDANERCWIEAWMTGYTSSTGERLH